MPSVSARYHRKYVIERVANSVRPVFEIGVDLDALALCGAEGLRNGFAVLFGSLAELNTTVAFGPLCEEVHHPPAGPRNPIDRRAPIAVTEHLDARQHALLPRPIHYESRRLAFALRDAGRSDFDAIDPRLGEQQPSQLEFLRGKIRDVGGLLSIPEGGIHHCDAFFVCGLHANLRVGRENLARSLALSTGEALPRPLRTV